MRDAAVVLRPHQQLHPGAFARSQRRGEQLVDVAFAIGHIDQRGIRTLVGELLAGVVTLKPLLTFLVRDAQPVALRGGAAEAAFGARHDLRVAHPQRLSLRCDRQGRVQQQPDGLVAIVADRPQALGLGMRGVVQIGRVLRAQHHRLVAHALPRRLGVGGEDVLGLDRVVVEEAIGRLGLAPRTTRLRNGRARMRGEILGDTLQTFHEASVTQGGVGEFVAGPASVLYLFLGCGSRHPPIRYISG
jgi:hypothetical protein